MAWTTASDSPTRPEAADVSGFVSRLLVSCLDIASIWSINHCPDDEDEARSPRQLLVFADGATLERLRKAADLQRPDVEVLVVVDGDRFENAWGPCCISGSLARWAWHYVSAHEARYDESRWDARAGHAGGVVRVARRAVLVWRAAAQR
jgi:hypothetical protein